MDALTAIMTRRSSRRFQEKLISNETIHQLLEAAMSAPSANNQQPWHFIVLTDRSLLNKIAAIHPHARMCAQAPLAIIPCGDPSITKSEEFWPQDLSAATQNILLAARALELGAVWCGVYPREDREKEIRSVLDIPKEIKPFCVIAIGHTDVEQKQVDRYQESRVHQERW